MHSCSRLFAKGWLAAALWMCAAKLLPVSPLYEGKQLRPLSPLWTKTSQTQSHNYTHFHMYAPNVIKRHSQMKSQWNPKYSAKCTACSTKRNDSLGKKCRVREVITEDWLPQPNLTHLNNPIFLMWTTHGQKSITIRFTTWHKWTKSDMYSHYMCFLNNSQSKPYK